MPEVHREKYFAHGLSMSSRLALPFDPTPAGKGVDLHLDLGEAWIDDVAAVGPLVAHVEGAGWFASHARLPDGYVSNYSDLVQFRLREDRCQVDVTPRSPVERPWAELFLAANYQAFLLFVRGRAPLHASAVRLPGTDAAVAFVGSPGSGKTTAAAAMLRVGADLITDDVLSVEVRGGMLVADPGARHLRLRSPVPGLETQHRTVDGRHSVQGRVAESQEPVRLAAVVAPRLDRDATRFELRATTPAESFALVGTDPRVKGLRHLPWVHQQFELAATVASTVPVVELVIPFASPDFEDMGRELTSQLRSLV